MPQVKENPVYVKWEEEIKLESLLGDVHQELFGLKRCKYQVLYFFHLLCVCEEETLFKLILFWMCIWNEQKEEESSQVLSGGEPDSAMIEDVQLIKNAIRKLLEKLGFENYRECLDALRPEKKLVRVCTGVLL